MYFKEYFNSVSEILENKYKAYILQKNPCDTGELCEIIVKDFLSDVFSGILKIYRGGFIMDSLGNKSEQIDIIICSQAAMKVFSDKGIFPIETVFGIINVKKILDHTNLFSNKKKDCGILKNIASIPKSNYRLVAPGNMNIDKVTEDFKKYWPYRVSFSYEGKIQKNWEEELNKMANDPEILKTLPDLIIVNKIGYIIRSRTGEFEFNDGSKEVKNFHLVTYKNNEQYFFGISHLVQEIYKSVQWQYMILPAYYEYFNNEVKI